MCVKMLKKKTTTKNKPKKTIFPGIFKTVIEGKNEKIRIRDKTIGAR